jgi:membrane-associated phospholipid phosphatase
MSIVETHAIASRTPFMRLLRLAQQNLFPDPRLWIMATIIMACDGLFILAHPRISLDPAWLIMPARIAVMAFTLSMLVGYFGVLKKPWAFKAHALFLCIAFAFFSGPVFSVLNQIVMLLPWPLMDSHLAAADRAMGFDWLAYAKLLTSTPASITAFTYFYNLIHLVVLGTSLLHLLRGDYRRTQELIAITMTSAAICVVIGAFFPAIGAMATLADSELASRLSPHVGRVFVQPLLELRSLTAQVWDIQKLQGLTSVPSYHTALGVFCVYSCWRIRYAREAMIVYATGMILSTPVLGGHYFIDVVAGLGFALGMIAVHRKWWTVALTTPGNVFSKDARPAH